MFGSTCTYVSSFFHINPIKRTERSALSEKCWRITWESHWLLMKQIFYCSLDGWNATSLFEIIIHSTDVFTFIRYIHELSIILKLNEMLIVWMQGKAIQSKYVNIKMKCCWLMNCIPEVANFSKVARCKVIASPFVYAILDFTLVFIDRVGWTIQKSTPLFFSRLLSMVRLIFICILFTSFCNLFDFLNDNNWFRW